MFFCFIFQTAIFIIRFDKTLILLKISKLAANQIEFHEIRSIFK